jgi:uncharacterized membrane protein YeaQ/YmgE (transglycosylase-associated protein family)
MGIISYHTWFDCRYIASKIADKWDKSLRLDIALGIAGALVGEFLFVYSKLLISQA